MTDATWNVDSTAEDELTPLRADTFAARRAELTARLTNLDDEYFYGNADPADIEAELEDRDYYKEVKLFWAPEGARWEALRNAAKQADIGKRIEDAPHTDPGREPQAQRHPRQTLCPCAVARGKLGELVDLVSQ